MSCCFGGSDKVEEKASLIENEEKEPKHEFRQGGAVIIRMSGRLTGSMQTVVNGEKCIVYIVSIATEYENWSVQRRFADFRKLHNDLKAEDFPLIPELPPRRTGGEEKFNINVIERRKVQLQSYIDELFAYENITHSATFQEYFELQVKDVKEDLCYVQEIGVDVGSLPSANILTSKALYQSHIVDPSQKFVNLYQTYTICAQCALSQSKGFHWRRALVRQQENKIWLVSDCSTHGATRILLCSSPAFFHKMMNFGPDWQFGLEGPDMTNAKKYEVPLPDLEDLKKDAGKVPPTVVEIILYRHGKLLNDTELEAQVNRYAEAFSKEYSYVFRLACKNAQDIERLNDRIMFVKNMVSTSEKMAKNNLVLAEGAYDIIGALCTLPNSCFGSSGIHPSVKIHMTKGTESTCVQELQHLFNLYKNNEKLKSTMVVNLILEGKLPNMEGVIAVVRRQVGIVRMLVISPERTPADIFARLQCNEQAENDARKGDEEGASYEKRDEEVDIYEVLARIEISTAGSIAVRDFIPGTVGHILEPFLTLVYNRKFSIRPSPFCSFFTCLVTNDSMVSYPVTRLVDPYAFFLGMTKILPKSLTLSQTRPTLKTNANKVTKVLRACSILDDRVPDVMGFLVDQTKKRLTRDAIKNTLVVVVHNNMDVSRIDLVRRCGCASLATSTLTGNGLSAACTGCL